MKIQIDKANLLRGIQIVQNTISSKISLPILNNILIETHGKQLRFIGTDLDVGISCVVPVNILSEGAITLPAKRIGDVIRELPSGEVTLIAKKNNMVDIESGKCRFKLLGLPKDEFPKLPEFKDKESIQIPREDLKEMLLLTSFAVSHEETRYILNGILLEIKEGVLRLVATDGRRLALAERNIGASAKKDISFILPIKAVQELVRNITDEGTVSL
ncbi:DNA polymerase III subunit beta, partial [Candidatus Omnitrophota bacterium]